MLNIRGLCLYLGLFIALLLTALKMPQNFYSFDSLICLSLFYSTLFSPRIVFLSVLRLCKALARYPRMTPDMDYSNVFHNFGTPALFCLCELSGFLNLSISRGTGHVRGSENHLLCRFMRSSGCLSFPSSLLHSGWLPVSQRYHSEEKTA